MAQDSRPNVIVFFTDQQRWDSMGLHGNPLDLTPNLDRMAHEGTHLVNCFTPQPVCGPARSIMQTGQYATTTGCFTNGRPLPRDADTIAKQFRAANYQTGYIGKWHIAPKSKRYDHPYGPVDEEDRAGYDYWLASNVLEFTSDAYQTSLYDNDGEEVNLPGYRVDACADAAIRYVDQHKENPFFLFLSFIEPHHQNHIDDYPPPDGYRERYTGRWTPPDLAALGGSSQQHLGGYWGMIKRLDEALGRLIDALKSMDILDNTIILFTSDHGCHFKTRNAEYKRSGHESSIHVPGMIRGPGFTGGGQINQPISLVDMVPTLLDAAGVDIPEAVQGESFLPLVADKNAPWRDDMFVQISEAGVGRAVRTAHWKYIVHAPDDYAGDGAWSAEFVENALYDLQCDPYELKNLIGLESHQLVAGRMRERLLARMTEAGEETPTITLAPSIPSGQRVVTPTEVEA